VLTFRAKYPGTSLTVANLKLGFAFRARKIDHGREPLRVCARWGLLTISDVQGTPQIQNLALFRIYGWQLA
jgi:hypothetical protein